MTAHDALKPDPDEYPYVEEAKKLSPKFEAEYDSCMESTVEKMFDRSPGAKSELTGKYWQLKALGDIGRELVMAHRDGREAAGDAVRFSW